MNTTAQNQNEVAQTILAQLGGASRLAMMAGCKDFGASPTSVHFKVGTNAKKIGAMKITLDPNDTYTVKFFTGRGVNLKAGEVLSDVYAEDLVRIFEEKTGMYLSF